MSFDFVPSEHPRHVGSDLIWKERSREDHALGGGRWSDFVSEGTEADLDAVAPVASPLERAISESKSILSLKSDFDGEGSPAYSEETWKRAAAVLRRLSDIAFSRNATLAVPYIDHGLNGSIDLYWKRDACDLLVNVPDTDAPPSYYGDDHKISVIKGKLDSEKRYRLLVAWLIEHQH